MLGASLFLGYRCSDVDLKFVIKGGFTTLGLLGVVISKDSNSEIRKFSMSQHRKLEAHQAMHP